eukprot:1414404-Pyramimonas_sp.AAC.1
MPTNAGLPMLDIVYVMANHVSLTITLPQIEAAAIAAATSKNDPQVWVRARYHASRGEETFPKSPQR